MDAVLNLKPPSFTKVLIIVLVGHILAAFMMVLTSPFSTTTPVKPSKLVVKTVKLAPIKPVKKTETPKDAPPKPVSKTTPKVEPKAAPKAEPKPAPKGKPKVVPKQQPKVAPKVPPKMPPKSPPKTLPKQTAPKSNELTVLEKKKAELLAKAENSLSQAKRAPAKESLKVPEIAFTSEETFSSEQRSYRDELIGRLKLLLKLPEYGLVKLRLTIGKAGNVAKLEVLSATSSLNRKQIEKALPTLSFPPPGKNGDKSGNITFNLTLSSD